MNMAWERWTELGNCEDYWITDVEYDACVIFYNETGGGDAPRVSHTVLQWKMGERRFVEAFLMWKYCCFMSHGHGSFSWYSWSGHILLRGFRFQVPMLMLYLFLKYWFLWAFPSKTSILSVYRSVFSIVERSHGSYGSGCWWHWELPRAGPTVRYVSIKDSHQSRVNINMSLRRFMQIMKNMETEIYMRV